MNHLSPDDQVDALEREPPPRVAAHLAACDRCRREVEDLEATIAAARGRCRAVAIVLAGVARASPVRRTDGRAEQAWWAEALWQSMGLAARRGGRDALVSPQRRGAAPGVRRLRRGKPPIERVPRLRSRRRLKTNRGRSRRRERRVGDIVGRRARPDLDGPIAR
jgi:anti-sigma factor RsiW